MHTRVKLAQYLTASSGGFSLGGTTNLHKTQYAYSYIAAGSGGGRQLLRTEQEYTLGAWVNNNKLTYKYNSVEWLNFEQRHDWVTGAWSSKYDNTQVYDKVGNRTGYDHNIAVGTATSYCRAMNLSYTYDAQNKLTAVSDADETQYAAAVTCDANNNITQSRFRAYAWRLLHLMPVVNLGYVNHTSPKRPSTGAGKRD